MTTNLSVYARVSTEQQDIEKQIEQLTNYTERHYPESSPSLFKDESTGTNTERGGYKRLMDSIEEYDVVIVRSVSRVSRSIRDLSRIADEFEQAETKLEFVNEPIEIDPASDDPYSKAMFQLLGVFAELEAEMTRQRIKDSIQTLQEDGFNWGRAPLGFKKNDGELIPTSDFDSVCTVLEMVDEDEMSQRKGAQRLDTSRTTIRRAIENGDRRELYGLDD
jgi:DNA invertase Pin-like site-specific DNA recombinase